MSWRVRAGGHEALGRQLVGGRLTPRVSECTAKAKASWNAIENERILRSNGINVAGEVCSALSAARTGLGMMVGREKQRLSARSHQKFQARVHRPITGHGIPLSASLRAQGPMTLALAGKGTCDYP